MSLGETIYHLRSERSMSQGDLADLLEVSRQSVSRWETDSATPELDKLVKLSGIFNVTLDELVTGAKPDPAPEPVMAAIPPQAQSALTPRKIVGIILLCMGFLVTMLLTLLGSFLSGLLLASPFLLCGVICLTARRHLCLWCGWGLYLTVDLYLRFATGRSWKMTRLTLMWSQELNYMRLAIAWVQLLVMLLLIALTLVAFRKVRPRLTGKKKVLFIAGWVFYAATHIPLPLPISFYNDFRFLAALVVAAIDWAQMGLLTALVVITLGLLRGRKKA